MVLRVGILYNGATSIIIFKNPMYSMTENGWLSLQIKYIIASVI